MNRQPRADNLLLHMQQKVVSPGTGVQSAKLCFGNSLPKLGNTSDRCPDHFSSCGFIVTSLSVGIRGLLTRESFHFLHPPFGPSKFRGQDGQAGRNHNERRSGQHDQEEANEEHRATNHGDHDAFDSAQGIQAAFTVRGRHSRCWFFIFMFGIRTGVGGAFKQWLHSPLCLSGPRPLRPIPPPVDLLIPSMNPLAPTGTQSLSPVRV